VPSHPFPASCRQSTVVHTGSASRIYSQRCSNYVTHLISLPIIGEILIRFSSPKPHISRQGIYSRNQLLPQVNEYTKFERQLELFSMMDLLNLANELLLSVAEYLDDLCSLNAFARTNRRLYCLLNSMLYKYDSRQDRAVALNWAARQGLEQTAHLSLTEGTNVDSICSRQEPKTGSRSIAQQDPLRNLTPLQIAIGCRHECVVRLLVE
jgi:hypothetical protein